MFAVWSRLVRLHRSLSYLTTIANGNSHQLRRTAIWSDGLRQWRRSHHRTQSHEAGKSIRNVNTSADRRRSDILSDKGRSSSPASVQLKPTSGSESEYFDFSSSANDYEWRHRFLGTMLIYPDFISQDEEISILEEVEPYMNRLHYETSHWDDAISNYRETERNKWNKKNTLTIDRIGDTAFPSNVPRLKLVHVLDLAQKGHIKPHIDSVRFCGNTIAGLSLLSDCVMRLRHDVKKDFYCDVLLPRYSLYVMSDFVRYDFTHEILAEADSKFKGQPVLRQRRISVMCRNEPSAEEAATSGPVFVPLASDR